MHIQWHLMGRVSLVNQVVGVQGQGEQRHGKDLKFGCFVNNISSDKVVTQFSWCRLLTLYLLHDQMFLTCHIIKWISSQQKPCKLTGHFQRRKKLCGFRS